jgi:iron complex transport system ATP-binding protein
MQPDRLLSADDLAIGYASRSVGRDLNLELQAGEVFCLLGPNGCGKTTLFKTLLGLLPAQGGTVRLRGTDIAALSRAEIARTLAYVPQMQSSAFPFTAEAIVLMGRVIHRPAFASPSKEDRAIARHALERLGIGALAERDVTRLSGGQRQLVGIARALAQQAALIVMDEPTASLDFGNQARVLAEIRHLAAQGVGILLSTHDPDHAFALASRVALMKNGAIVAQGNVADVMQQERLEDIYNVPVCLANLPNGQKICAPDFAAMRPQR